MRTFALIAVLLLSACGDDDSGDPGSYVSVTEYSTVAKASWCTYLTSCGLFPDQQTCTAANIILPAQLQLAPEIVAAVKAGRLLYNGNNAKTCLDGYANATCDKTDEAGRAPTPECDLLIRGAVDADGTCYQDAECISGDCQILVADETCAMGKCIGNMPPPPLELPHQGESCASLGRCSPNLVCSNMTATCEPLHTAGMSCTTNADCEYGLGCTGSPRTCKTLPTTGQPCPDFECRDEGTHCATTGCVAVGLADASCQNSTDCSSYYVCDFTTSKCKRGPITGEACQSGGSRCFDASFCDSSTLKCVPFRGAGEICTSSLQCASTDCDFTTNVCIDPVTCP